MYKPYEMNRPGIRVPVNLNITAFASASGIVAADSTKRYYLMGWDLHVPSGTIGVKFRDGSNDVTGEFVITSSAPSTGNCLYHVGLNKPIQIKTSANVNSLKGDVFYEEAEVITEQSVASIDHLEMGPRPEL